jgi:hypothetical protein
MQQTKQFMPATEISIHVEPPSSTSPTHSKVFKVLERCLRKVYVVVLAAHTLVHNSGCRCLASSCTANSDSQAAGEEVRA